MVHIVRLNERGLLGLDSDERARALSMVGNTLEVREIDEYGRPCVMKEFVCAEPDATLFHEIALDADEFEVVDARLPQS